MRAVRRYRPFTVGLATTYLGPLLVLFATVVIHERSGDDFAHFSRDLVQQFSASPLTGVQSTLGSIAWFSGAAIGFFAWYLLHRWGRRDLDTRFIGAMAAFLLIMGIDDTFLLHDGLGPEFLGIDERPFIAFYGLVMVSILVGFRKVLARREPVLGGLGFLFLACSVGVDHFQEQLEGWPYRIFFEDAFKFLGIVGLAGYVVRQSLQLLLVERTERLGPELLTRRSLRTTQDDGPAAEQPSAGFPRSADADSRSGWLDQVTVTLPVTRLRIAVWGVVGLLVVADFVAAVAGAKDILPYLLLRFVDADQKTNFPTAAKTTLLLVAGLLMLACWVVGRRRSDPSASGWLMLAAATFFAFVDESTYLHQSLSEAMQKAFDLDGALKYAWTLVYAPAGLVVGVFLLKSLRAMDPRVRNLVLPGGVLFVGGALGLEPVKSHISESQGDRGLAFRLAAAVSDSLELCGLALLVTGLVLALDLMVGRFTVAFGTRSGPGGPGPLEPGPPDADEPSAVRGSLTAAPERPMAPGEPPSAPAVPPAADGSTNPYGLRLPDRPTPGGHPAGGHWPTGHTAGHVNGRGTNGYPAPAPGAGLNGHAFDGHWDPDPRWPARPRHGRSPADSS